MKTDKELLELAAKAAGYNIKSHEDGKLYSDCRCAGYWGVWNPLTDDGDALRLAVRLEMTIDCYDLFAHVSSCGSTFAEYSNVDQTAATRRAIVRAAAAIGEWL